MSISSGVPGHLSAQFRRISDTGLGSIRASLEQHYFAFPRVPKEYLASEWGQQDLQNHLVRRLRRDREEVIPWLDEARPLRDSKVLEIGCGTGCSTVALAEQGAKVIGIDLDEPSLEVARKRCEVYGLDVTFRLANALDVGELYGDLRFDLIIFYASLEHMTHHERISAIRTTWDMLPPGGLLSVVDTPNRLWHTDSHTSLLPFFHWLPDELAFDYSRFSSRPDFRDRYDHYDDEQQRLHFLRRGRGVSFHEFVLALGSIEQLNVQSSLAMYRREAGLKRRPWPGHPAAMVEEALLAADKASAGSALPSPPRGGPPIDPPRILREGSGIDPREGAVRTGTGSNPHSQGALTGGRGKAGLPVRRAPGVPGPPRDPRPSRGTLHSAPLCPGHPEIEVRKLSPEVRRPRGGRGKAGLSGVPRECRGLPAIRGPPGARSAPLRFAPATRRSRSGGCSRPLPLAALR